MLDICDFDGVPSPALESFVGAAHVVPPNATAGVLAMNDELHVRVTITDLPRDIKIRIGALVDGPHRTCVPAWHCNRIPSIRGRIACANILENLLERVASPRETTAEPDGAGGARISLAKNVSSKIYICSVAGTDSSTIRVRRWHRTEQSSGAGLRK